MQFAQHVDIDIGDQDHFRIRRGLGLDAVCRERKIAGRKHSGLAHEIQAGDALHLNLAVAYEILPNKIRLGINGYFLNQLHETKMNGNDLSDTEEQVFGIGPGLVYHISKDAHFFFNAFIETGAENRPEGSRMNFRFVYHF